MPLGAIPKEWSCRNCDAKGTEKTKGKQHVMQNHLHTVEFVETYMWASGRQPNYNGLTRG